MLRPRQRRFRVDVQHAAWQLLGRQHRRGRAAMSKEIVEHIIRKFGSQQRVAELLGIWQTSVAGWLTRGAIPERRQEELLAAARREGIDISLADFTGEAIFEEKIVAGSRRTISGMLG